MGLIRRWLGRERVEPEAAFLDGADGLTGQLLAGIRRDALEYAKAVAGVVSSPEEARRFLGETATVADDLYGSWMGQRRYNPDLLAARKGGLAIYKEMRQDDQVKASLHLKKAAIIKSGWSIECGHDGQKEFLEAVLADMEGTVEDAVLSILSAFDYGFSLNEIVYRYLEGGPFDGKLGLRALRPKSPTRIEFDTDEYGAIRPDGIIQRQNTGELRRLSVEKFVLFSYQKEFDNHFGESDLRAAYRFWFLKTNFFKYWAVYLERFGMPLALGTSEKASLLPAEQEAFRNLVRNIQAGMSAVLPQGLTIDFKEAAQSRAETFSKAVDACDVRIARAILLPQLVGLAPQGDVGSLARATVEADTLDLVLGGTSRTVADLFSERVLRPLQRMNFGASAKPARFVFNPMREQDKQALAKAWGEVVSKKAARTTIETEKHVRTLLSFPEMTPEEERQAEQERQAEEEAAEAARKAQEAMGAGPAAGKGNGRGNGAGEPVEPGAGPEGGKNGRAKVFVLTTANPQEARKAWHDHVGEIEGLEAEARAELEAAFEGSIQALVVDAGKKS